MNLEETHKQELRSAMLLLENPGIAAKITSLVGMPIKKGLELLPRNWNEKIEKVTQIALMKAADAAIFTLKKAPGEEPSNWWHKIGVALTGGIGGFLGLPALTIELPVSTTIMLRSIAEIARSEGETVNDYGTKLACLEVFALGGKNKSDENTESGYFIMRAALAKSVAEAAEFAATKSIAEEGAPALLRFIINIAQRFSIQVTEKAAAQAIPAIGAAGGAIINTIFIDHFQDMAKGHFIVRRLEKIYGKEIIKAAYEELIKLETA
jgi:EcsC protein family